MCTRLMSLYVKGQTAEDSVPILKELVAYVIQVYAATWFQIECHSYFHLQLLHTFFSNHTNKQTIWKNQKQC